MLERAEAALAGIDLLPYAAAIRDLAGGSAFEPPLRALDAIHLATAMTVRAEIGTVLVYDEALFAAAAAVGLAPLTPS